MNSEDIRTYQFDGFCIDSSERLLRLDGEVVSLTPKAVDTLLALLASPGRMVDKETLMKAVWPDTFVEEGALIRNVSVLRKTLGKSRDDKEYIETIPRRGYRFVGSVGPKASPDSAAAVVDAVDLPEDMDSAVPISVLVEAIPASIPPKRQKRRWFAVGILTLGFVVALTVLSTKFWVRQATAPVHVLAVLPFENLSRDPAQDYFAEGLTEVLISGLTRIGSLRVISLASVSAPSTPPQAPAQRARAWHADAVLRCTVVKNSDRVRIHAELIDVRTAALYWSEDYERGMDDAWSLQNEVASAIAREIRVKLSPAESQILASARKVDPRALNAYLRGRYAWNRRTEQQLRVAIEYFNEAIALQPNDALAYSGLADSYSVLASNGTDGMRPNEAMPIAKANALKALQLDATLAEAHASLANILMSWEWNMPEAEKEFRRSIELNPRYATAHQWYSHLLLATGRLDEAQREMKQALEIEPLSLVINVGAGWCQYFARHYDEAIEIYKNTLKMDPNFPLAHQTLGMAYAQKQMYQESLVEFRQAADFSGGSAASIAGLANAYALAGRAAEAKQQVERLEALARKSYVPSVLMANAYRSLGDDRRVYHFLGLAIAERSDYLIYVRSDPALETIIKNPNIGAMLSLLKPIAR